MDLISLYQENLMNLTEIRKELAVIFEKICDADNQREKSELLRLIRIELDIMNRAANLAAYKLERLNH
jgi:hypothetical protein